MAIDISAQQNKWRQLDDTIKKLMIGGSIAALAVATIAFGPGFLYFVIGLGAFGTYVIYPEIIEKWFDAHQPELVGAAVGLAIGGPIGVVLGAWIGHFINQKFLQLSNKVSNLADSANKLADTVKAPVTEPIRLGKQFGNYLKETASNVKKGLFDLLIGEEVEEEEDLQQEAASENNQDERSQLSDTDYDSDDESSDEDEEVEIQPNHRLPFLQFPTLLFSRARSPEPFETENHFDARQSPSLCSSSSDEFFSCNEAEDDGFFTCDEIDDADDKTSNPVHPAQEAAVHPRCALTNFYCR